MLVSFPNSFPSHPYIVFFAPILLYKLLQRGKNIDELNQYLIIYPIIFPCTNITQLCIYSAIDTIYVHPRLLILILFYISLPSSLKQPNLWMVWKLLYFLSLKDILAFFVWCTCSFELNCVFSHSQNGYSRTCNEFSPNLLA